MTPIEPIRVGPNLTSCCLRAGAIEIRKQLRRYMLRFRLPIVTCGEDSDQVRKAIVM